jgi:hypothetical protein
VQDGQLVSRPINSRSRARARARAAKPGRPSLGGDGPSQRLEVLLPTALHQRLLEAVTARGESAGSIVRTALERELPP